MKISRIFDLLDKYKANINKPDAFVSMVDGKWAPLSSEKYIEESHLFSYGLMSLGFKKGDKIATISNNHPNWNIADMGMLMAGVVHVPIFNTLSEAEYKQILTHAEVKAIIISNKSIYNRIKFINEGSEQETAIYAFSPIDNVALWYSIIELGRKNKAKYEAPLEALKESISENDFATLIYTSGTTGNSKGVMLSHRNLVHNFTASANIFKLSSSDNYMSFLPLCHVGSRMGNYQTQFSGCSIYYAENMATIAKNMKEIQPAGFDAVPRILEKIYESIISKGNKLKGIQKSVFFWAVKKGKNYRISSFYTPIYNLQLKIADKLVFSKWREAFGGNVRIVGCGGASLQPHLERVFWAAGIKIMNMYGLSETSPIITINRTEKPLLKLGSVGALIDGVEMKIAKDGEILCRGHNVMLGYYKNPKLTAEVIDKDAWFHTGDIGRIEDGKFLFVTDRKKEIFKLSNGKYIAPQNIEGKLKNSLFIDQAMVIGEHEKYASALISPNFSYLKDWSKEHGLDALSKTEMVNSALIQKAINEEVKKVNKSLSEPERISRIKLVMEEWAPDSGELSPTLKLKRKFISNKYQNEIQEIYVKNI